MGKVVLPNINFTNTQFDFFTFNGKYQISQKLYLFLWFYCFYMTSI